MSLPLMTMPPAGEMTLLQYWKRAATELDGTAREVLNHLARSLMERGWLPSYDELLRHLVDEMAEAKARDAIASLVRWRLLTLDAAGKRLSGLLGSISTTRTPHRGHLADGVDVFCHGGLELIALNPMLAKPVDGFTQCGQCSAAIVVKVAGEVIVDTEPSGIAGFQANWDGTSPLEASVYARSPLFCGDVCLEQWMSANPGVEGMPLSGDLLLFVGMGMLQELGHRRYEALDMGY